MMHVFRPGKKGCSICGGPDTAKALAQACKDLPGRRAALYIKLLEERP